MDRKDLSIGQGVRVRGRNGNRPGQPRGGWPGEVVRIGRTLVDIVSGAGKMDFRIDSQKSNDDVGYYSFKTLEQAALDDRLDTAVETLRASKVTLGFGHGLTLEQIEELADVVRTFLKED